MSSRFIFGSLFFPILIGMTCQRDFSPCLSFPFISLFIQIIYMNHCVMMTLQDTNLLLTGGFEKILRIFDLNRPDAPPREIDSSPGSVRTVAWLHSDQTILSSSADAGGLR